MPLRLIETRSRGERTVKLYRDIEWDEYRVRALIDGYIIPNADYHTDDLGDAHDTMTAMLRD